jgi:GTP cyclohydrolase I
MAGNNGTIANNPVSPHSMDELSLLLDRAKAGHPANTPLREDAFDLSDEEKILIISRHFREIMQTLGLDLEDDSLQDTPDRIAHMYVKEIFRGLNPKNMPDVKLFRNKYHYNQMLIEKNITFYSWCEHHFLPFTGKVHAAYFSAGTVIGLSKINRIVQYCASRPQVQERLTVQIANELKSALNTQDIAVFVEATHFCVSSRGTQDIQSSTVTSFYDGRFRKEEIKAEFLSMIR